MADSAKDIRTKYPLVSRAFRVTIMSGGGQSSVAWGFSEVSGLEIAYDNQIYRDGLSYVAGVTVLRGIAQPVNITLKRGIIPDRTELMDWIQEQGGLRSAEKRKRDLLFSQLSASGDPVLNWKVIGAEPVKLTGPDFKADDATGISIETLALVAESVSVLKSK
jgi:phage tail-like protein